MLSNNCRGSYLFFWFIFLLLSSLQPQLSNKPKTVYTNPLFNYIFFLFFYYNQQQQQRPICTGIIWGITFIATMSVISGLHVGIKFISQIAFFGGVFILLVVLFLGNTSFFLNGMVQATGYYLQYFMTQLGWHTDAFAQLGYGEGGAPDMLGASKSGQEYGGSPSFMDGWTIFYWGWWIAWSPFVGTLKIAFSCRSQCFDQPSPY